MGNVVLWSEEVGSGMGFYYEVFRINPNLEPGPGFGWGLTLFRGVRGSSGVRWVYVAWGRCPEIWGCSVLGDENWTA